MIEKGFTALKNGTWQECKETFKEKRRASEWAFDKMKEAFGVAAKDEVEKMSIVQETVLKSTDYLRRIIAPEDKEVSTCARPATVSPWEITTCKF